MGPRTKTQPAESEPVPQIEIQTGLKAAPKEEQLALRKTLECRGWQGGRKKGPGRVN